MKPELMAEYMRKRRADAKLVKQANHLPESKLEIPESIRANMGKVTDPDKFIGLHDPEYYNNLCQFCGCPETKLMSRNGFSGYLCSSHSFEATCSDASK